MIRLPDKIDYLYLDVETTSGDRRVAALDPFSSHCKPYSVAITWDDEPNAIYLQTTTPGFCETIEKLLAVTDAWVNHNVRFDAHVINRNVCELPKHVRLVDTLTLAKLIDSERIFRGGYGLDVLSRDWLCEDISAVEQALKTALAGSKDYGYVPHEIMEPYAKQDVLTNRKLFNYIRRELPKPLYRVKDLEVETTRTLFEIENNGVYIDKRRLLDRAIGTKTKLDEILTSLMAEFGFPIEPHVPNDCRKLLCDTLGLPVLGYTKAGKPAFNKKALQKYLALGQHREIVKTILSYRKVATFFSGFIRPAIKYMVDSSIHVSFVQLVRTGRMACRRPNFQALSKLAKETIIPRPGYGFIVADYSQIELRLIACAANERAVIEEYKSNPLTDFHQFTAELAGIERSFAKTLNFAIAFGAGERSTIESLSTQESIQKAVREIPGDYQTNLVNHIKKLRTAYFQRFPRIMPAAREARYACKVRGYTENSYGRRRHLVNHLYSFDDSRKAFNAQIQGTAADVMKDCLNALQRSIEASGRDVRILAVVHDEIVLEAPGADCVESGPLVRDIARILENPSVTFEIPLKVQIGVSGVSWLDGKSDEKARFVEYSGENLEYFTGHNTVNSQDLHKNLAEHAVIS
jgi:DNA polymerase-1